MLAMPTTMVGQVGADGGADFMTQQLQQRGVAVADTVRRIDGTPTGVANVMLLPDGENSIIIVGGANTAAWQLSDAQRAAILSAGVVLLQARPAPRRRRLRHTRAGQRPARDAWVQPPAPPACTLWLPPHTAPMPLNPQVASRRSISPRCGPVGAAWVAPLLRHLGRPHAHVPDRHLQPLTAT